MKAAGIMFVADGHVLLLKRGPRSDHPGEWSFPGGQHEGDETTEETAIRETIEEIGRLPEGERSEWTRTLMPRYSPNVPADEKVDFTTYLQSVTEQFVPQLSSEHDDWIWVKTDNLPEPLHPGAAIAIARMTMDETEIAHAMAAGYLTSPQHFENIWLFDIRITGTGRSYRAALKEHVWRDPEIYLNDWFLERCNGLPVIINHPKMSMLNTKEFSKRIIGTITKAYIKDDEVWGIAKIWDEHAAKIMSEEEISTSPAVVFRDPSVNSVVEFNDGQRLLIEGKPSLLDHIAICQAGVWDKGGAPSGVVSVIRGDMQVSGNETSPAPNTARSDENIDKVLTHLDARWDAFNKRMDAIEKRYDAWDKARKDAEEAEEKKKKEESEREDAARRDRAARRDAEHEEWKKADAAMCDEDDKFEEKKKGEYKEKGDPEETAADKARKDRRDRMDARRHDAEEEERKEKEKADAARSDAAIQSGEIARLKAQIEVLMNGRSDDDRALLQDAQARYDAVYSLFGKRASPPMVAETLTDYRVRQLRGLKQYSKSWKDMDDSVLANEKVLAVADEQIRADAEQAGKEAVNAPDGQLREVRRRTEGGHEMREFYGKGTFIRGMKRPGRHVTAISGAKGN